MRPSQPSKKRRRETGAGFVVLAIIVTALLATGIYGCSEYFRQLKIEPGVELHDLMPSKEASRIEPANP